jgi:hypothetical protein
MAPNDFYKSQLIVLGLFVVCALLLERYVDNRKKAAAAALKLPLASPSTPHDRDGSRSPLIHDPVDDDDAPLANGHAVRMATREQGPSSSSKSLAWRYLVVYAVVMGVPYFLSLFSDLLNIFFFRSRLASRPVRLLALQGPIPIPRKNRCGPIRNWLYICRVYCSTCWSVGRSIVRLFFTGFFPLSYSLICISQWSSTDVPLLLHILYRRLHLHSFPLYSYTIIRTRSCRPFNIHSFLLFRVLAHFLSTSTH